MSTIVSETAGQPRAGRLHVLGALVLVVLAYLSWSGEAYAQTITLDVTNTRRQLPYRQARQWWINYEECLANDVFSFPLSVTDTGPRVEVWAGNQDCAAIRGNVDRGQCWILASRDNARDTFTIDVPVRNIVARRVNTLTVPEGLPASVCDESTDSDGEQFTFYFILQEGGRSVASTTWNASDAEGTGFDMVGPAPPRRVSVGVGESQLAIRMNGIEEDNDRERFEAFCVPADTLIEPIDAGGAVFDGGSGAAVDGGVEITPAPRECFTDVIQGGVRPPPQFSCGVGAETASTLRTSRLSNGTMYAVGVAGQDTVGNAGVLSEIACGMPVPLDDFFEVYNRNGGLGGGGFCTLRRGPGTGGASGRVTLTAVALLAAAATWRRRRSSW